MSRNKNRRKKYREQAAVDSPVVSASASDVAVSDSADQAVSADKTWITDYAWISGVAGVVAVMICAFYYESIDALNQGLDLGLVAVSKEGVSILWVDFKATWYSTVKYDSLLVALFIITSIMLITEGVRLWLWDKENFFKIAPDLQSKKYSFFIVNCLGNWLLNLTLLGLVLLFYKSANEYGYLRQHEYYRAWFRCIDIIFDAYLYLGVFYVLITRAIKHSPEADKRDISTMFAKVLWYFFSKVSGMRSLRPKFEDVDKKSARALLVKMFFAPLMTVFFMDQFPHMVQNVNHVLNVMANGFPGYYQHRDYNNDYFNISLAFIFTIDVALAWCGYIISSRWVDNQTVSAEPTMLGWVVCLICYPPFQMALGVYYASPNEREFLNLGNDWIVTLTTTMMLLSYFVYMSATLWFGCRFSNLTNRGIIRKGPFAFIRHPAYMSKNFSWWCVSFPTVMWYAMHAQDPRQLTIAAVHTLGLIFTTYVYYWRAITEERHLMADPYYRSYCKQVKYRFIPGVF